MEEEDGGCGSYLTLAGTGGGREGRPRRAQGGLQQLVRGLQGRASWGQVRSWLVGQMVRCLEH